MADSVEDFFERCTQIIRDRGESYASPAVNIDRIGRMWTTYLGTVVGPYDVCVMMAMLKMARLCNGFHQDSIDDAAAYLALASSLSETRMED